MGSSAMQSCNQATTQVHLEMPAPRQRPSGGCDDVCACLSACIVVRWELLAALVPGYLTASPPDELLEFDLCRGC